MAFLDEGSDVIVTYRKKEELQGLKSATGANSRLQAYEVDVTDEASVRQFVDSAVAKYRHLDCLVNTVGGYIGGVKLWELDPSVFDRMLDLNLRSGYLLSHAAVPAMLHQRSGSIVNVISKAAIDHAAGAGAYSTSKAAALAMMDSLAEDLKGTGVRSNSVLPSIIDTEANRKAMPNHDFAKWPKPEQIARVLLFLCSEDANVVHGAALPVYGHT